MTLLDRAHLVRTVRRWSPYVWPALQQAAAAMIAWLIARDIVGNHDPFFAPVSAVVALNAPLGERGRNTVRLLLGVGMGIVVGEVAVVTLGGGYAAVAIASFVAMVIARALRGAPIVVAQAGISAILTLTTADDHFGANRLVDAAIGGCVALVFSQVLFSPEPVRLLRRSEVRALSGMAGGLETMAQALENDDADLAARAVTSLRELRDGLAELSRLRRVGVRVARHSAIWRSQVAPVVRETEDAGHLDLLDGAVS